MNEHIKPPLPNPYLAQLRRLVRAGDAMRRTAIVDDDFPMHLARFDAELRLAEQLLEERGT